MKHLLCLTSLTHRRFIEDAIAAVSLPAGTPLRLRYRTKYVAPEVLSAIAQQSVRAAAIGIIDQYGDTKTNRTRLLRWGKISTFEIKGSLLLIDLSLDGFANHEVRITNSASPVKHFVSTMPADEVPASEQPSVAEWEQAAGALLDSLNLGGRPDLGAMKLQYVHYVELVDEALRKRLGKTGALCLNSGETLRLDVHTLTRQAVGDIKAPIGEVLLEIHNEAAGFVSSRRIRVDSRRDVKRISVAASPVFRRTSGHLSIRAVTFLYKPQSSGTESAILLQDVPDERLEQTHFRHDVELSVGHWKAPAASALVALGIALTTVRLETGVIWQIKLAFAVVTFAIAFAGLTFGLRRN